MPTTLSTLSRTAVTPPVNARARSGISARRSAHGTYVHTTVQTTMRRPKSHSSGSGTPSVASRVSSSSTTARISARMVASHRHAACSPGRLTCHTLAYMRSRARE